MSDTNSCVGVERPPLRSRPVIFLDMDGVISTRRAYLLRAGISLPDRWIDSAAMANLNALCSRSRSLIVISSTWRLNSGRRAFLAMMRRNDFTGTIHSDWRTKSLVSSIPGSSLVAATMRGDEIREWLSRHSETRRHVILDDDNDFYPDQPLVKTAFEDGLTEWHVARGLDLLETANA